MSPKNLLTEWSRLLIGSLASAGVRHVVLSPGSRSTPFAHACLNHAELATDVIVDERSAGFYALGYARQSGLPSLLVCTSGSAASHYYPAVVEASLSFTPLLVLSADRPWELADSGAPQTVDQSRMFGEFARQFVELGNPEADLEALRGLRRRASQAVALALAPTPGPVQINARARKPLEPVRASEPEELELAQQVDRLLERPVSFTAAARGLDPERARELAGRLGAARRPLLVSGPLAPARAPRADAVRQLLRLSAALWVREAASQQRFWDSAAVPVIDNADLLCSCPTFLEQFQPDCVLQLGPAPTSGTLGHVLARAPERHVLIDHGFSDPWNNASSVQHVDFTLALQALSRALEAAPNPSRWARSQSHYDRCARQAVSEELAAAEWSEASVMHACGNALPPGSVLMLGNSLAIREFDLYCRAAPLELTVLSQRGANGIDGMISGAAGAARAARRPLTLITGDLSLLHDIGGLAALKHVATPLRLVVINNDGGRIFEQLPLADCAELRRDAWFTPHGLSFAAAAELFGVNYRRVASLPELRAGLEAAGAGCWLIEASVPPHDAAERRAALVERTEARLRAQPPQPEVEQRL